MTSSTQSPRGLVLFAHGARDPRWAQPIHQLCTALQEKSPGLSVRVAFLELQEPFLNTALQDLSDLGITDISLAPIFWSLGGHVARDLPEQIAAFTDQHPNTTIRVLPVLSQLPQIDTFLVESLLSLHNRHAVTAQTKPGLTFPRPTSFEVGPYLKEIGRGKKGSRGLGQQDAYALMRAILRAQVDPVSLGGVLLALRMKGESVEEIAGFLAATEETVERLAPVSPGWVVLPSYNGARSLPNLVPLLAMLLTRAGIPVVVHGTTPPPGSATQKRISTQDIFTALGVPACATLQDATAICAQRLPVNLHLSQFSPELAALLALRTTMGVRNVGHTLAKLIRPVNGKSLLVTSYTHPEFGKLQDELFTKTQINAMSLRATEGESVVSVKRTQAIDLWHLGIKHTVVQAYSVEPDNHDLPARDAEATAVWTREVLEGKRPVPAGIQAQLEAISQALAQ